MRQEHFDVLAEILEPYKLNLSHEQIMTIGEDFKLHLEMWNEYSSPPSYASQSKTECDKCISLEKDLKILESDMRVYENNIKKQHPGVIRVWVKNGCINTSRR